MASNQPPRPKSPRLTPNARAQLISDFNAGKTLSDPNYYVIKNKNGKLNVRRKKEGKEEKKEEQEAVVPAKEETVPEEPPKKPKAL